MNDNSDRAQALIMTIERPSLARFFSLDRPHEFS